jgi:hypothetical protein
MKKVLILAVLLLPTFAMASSGGVFKLVANDGKPAEWQNVDSTPGAPTFAAPVVPNTPVAQKEAEVAKKELGNVTPKSVAKKEAQVAASQSGLDTKVKETKVKAKVNKVLVEDGSAVLRYSTSGQTSNKESTAVADAATARSDHLTKEKATRQATASEAKTSLEGKK